MRTPTFVTLLAVTLATLVGCVPNSITLQFDGRPTRIDERTVARDGASRNKVAQIDLTGVITSTSTSPFGSAALLDDFSAMLDKAEKDSAVKAVLIHINSPGGSVAASETLAEMIETFKQRSKKPVVVSMGEVAASGGYYTAITADHIVAQPATITGSIGVIVPTINVSDGLSRLGITSRSVVSGPNKDIANPMQPANEEHMQLIQGIVDEFYQDFRSRVTSARPELKDPDTTLDGRVVTGRTALELGLVDELGGIRDAHEAAKRLAGLESAQLVKYYRGGPPPLTPYASASSQVKQTDQPGVLDAVLNWKDRLAMNGATDPGFYYLWLPPGALSID